MIDTDKYEGHTPAPWRFGKQGVTHSEDGKTAIIRPHPQLESIGGEDKVTLIAIHHGDATPKDLKLMIDAPLLLAEVNDLLAEIRQLNNIIGTFDDFMCNNWTPENVHSLWNELLTEKLWNELLTKEEEE